MDTAWQDCLWAKTCGILNQISGSDFGLHNQLMSQDKAPPLAHRTGPPLSTHGLQTPEPGCWKKLKLEHTGAQNLPAPGLV